LEIIRKIAHARLENFDKGDIIGMVKKVMDYRWKKIVSQAIAPPTSRGAKGEVYVGSDIPFRNTTDAEST